MPQTEWLKTTEIYYLTVLKPGRLKSRCRHDHAVSETMWWNLSLPLPSYLWFADDDLWLVGVLLQPLPLSSHGHRLPVCLSSLIIGVRLPVRLDERPTLLHFDVTLTNYIYNKLIPK